MMTNESRPTAHAPEEAPPGQVAPQYEGALKLFTVLHRAQAAVSRHSEVDISRHDLTVGEFAVLDVLYHRGRLLLGTIGEKILASSGGITFLVDRLEKRGLVARLACPEDRRARYAALTPEGIAFMDRIFPEHAEAIAQSSASLTESERDTLIDLLKKLGKGASSTPCVTRAEDLP